MVDVEKQVQALQRNVYAETAILELATPVHRSQRAVLHLLHQNDAIQDARHGSGCDCEGERHERSIVSLDSACYVLMADQITQSGAVR